MRRQIAVRLDIIEPAVVAAIEFAVGTDREAVGAAAGAGDDRVAAVGLDSGDGAPLDLDDDRLVPEDLRMAYRILKNAGLSGWTNTGACQ